jgi:hypothetical protein
VSTVDVVLCGGSTVEVAGTCEVTDEVCGAGTEFSDGSCELDFVPITCGSGTANDGGEVCVGTLACGDGTTFIEEEEGEICLEDSRAELTAESFAARAARNFCDSCFNCCELDDITEGRVEFGPVTSDYIACLEGYTLIWDYFSGLAEARVMGSDATVDIERLQNFEDFFKVDDSCNLLYDEDIQEIFDGDPDRGGGLPSTLWEGNREVGESCLTTTSCDAPLVCGNPDGSDGGDRCVAPGGVDDPCQTQLECARGLYCNPSDSECARAAGEASACTSDYECESGLSCFAGFCRPIASTGFVCDTIADCGDRRFCEAEDDRCMDRLVEDDPCVEDDQCGAGLICYTPEGEDTATCSATMLICDYSFF